MIIPQCLLPLETAGAVETVRADFALRKSDRLDKGLERIEFQGGQTKAVGDDLHHPFIFRRIGCRVLVEILVLVAFQLLDDAASNQLQVAL